MKKILAFILAAALALSMTACGGKSNAEDTKTTPSVENEATTNADGGEDSASEETSEPEETPEPEDDVVSYQLDDTVSSDILDFSLKKASLGYYAVGPKIRIGAGANYETTNIDEAYEPTDDPDSAYFKCNKGHVLVCVDFVITNTDRAKLNSLDFDWNKPFLSFELKQNDNTSTAWGYVLNDWERGVFDFKFTSISEDGGDFRSRGTTNIIMDPNVPFEVKTVLVADFEAEDLSAPFEFTVGLANSSGGVEKFVYSVG